MLMRRAPASGIAELGKAFWLHLLWGSLMTHDTRSVAPVEQLPVMHHGSEHPESHAELHSDSQVMVCAKALVL